MNVGKIELIEALAASLQSRVKTERSLEMSHCSCAVREVTVKSTENAKAVSLHVSMRAGYESY